jgi:prepilin-type N-terminal cleavage/methylation domain-containing protein/prepilin-type processing-associated H-X9-DG protein
MVDVKLVEVFPREVSLDELRGVKALADMELLRRGSRLSVQPVTAAQFATIARLAARRRRDGLTLVELLVVMAVVGVLIGLLVPAVQRARESARRAGCGNHLRQVGLAVATYETAGRFLPPGRTSQGSRGHSWAFSLLPFVDERSVFDALVAALPVHDDRNATAMRTPVPVFFCPSRRGPVADRNFDNNGEPPLVTGVAAAGDFAAVAGARLTYASSGGSCDPLLAGPIHTTSRVRLAQVTDGASRTLAVGERHLPPVDPAWPADLVHLHRGDTAFFSADTPTTLFREPTDGLGLGADDRAVDKFGGPHPGVTQFVFLDGHVDALAVDVDPQVLRWLCTIGDGHDPSAAAGGTGAGF